MSTPISLPERLLLPNLFVSEAQHKQPEASDLPSPESLKASVNMASAVGEIACQTTSEASERLTLRQRFARSKLARLTLSGLTVFGVAGGATLEASPAFADGNPVYTVVNPHIPQVLTILINKKKMDKLNDFQRTYSLTHEVGHTVGLGHTDALCKYPDTSIMDEGNHNTFKQTFNTPTNFDKIELKQLYTQ